MSIAFLSPFFLAGAALLAAPWIIHHIRRPEREPLRFSSLMFIPNVHKEVIERRRLQHILLMMLRMAMLILLAFAFARPMLKTAAAPSISESRARHVILLDTSYSMGTLDWFDTAKDRARDVLDSLNPDAEIAVVTFASQPATLAAFAADNAAPEAASGIERARRAIDGAEITQRHTSYLAALQHAQEMLFQDAGEIPIEGQTLAVHLISDFQKAGMPETAEGWKLSPRINFYPVEIGEGPAANMSLSDFNLSRDAFGKLRIRARVKNWADASAAECNVALMTGGAEAATQLVTIPPGNAGRVLFELPAEGAQTISGWLQLEQDALAIDNSRYFAWSPPPKVPTLIVGDPRESEQWPGAWLLKQAMPTGADAPWIVDTGSHADLAQKLANTPKPGLVIVADLNELSEETAQQLLQYVREGGQMLFALDTGIDAQTANDRFLTELGLASDGPAFDPPSPFRFSGLSWVDLDHPVFIPFRGAQFNNFSQIKFFEHHLLRIVDDSIAKSIARFESARTESASPAMVECALGEGRVMVWAFGLGLSRTDLAKNPRFVPLLFETLTHLSDLRDSRTEYLVGDQVDPPSVGAEFAPSDIAATPVATLTGEGQITGAGFITWSPPDADSAPRVEAVNVEANEADGTRISTGEFELRMCAAPDLRRVAGVARSADENELLQTPEGKELGYWLILALAASLLLETAYTRYLSR